MKLLKMIVVTYIILQLAAGCIVFVAVGRETGSVVLYGLGVLCGVGALTVYYKMNAMWKRDKR
ncbi:hypothetical protein HQ587_05000 [bacterium]|nr:hypothetical protein [bacterium]